MVTFTCDGCQATLKKKKVDGHFANGRCNSPSVSCVDCGVAFYGDDYAQHTSCISEAEKYQGCLYRPKNSKGNKNSSNPYNKGGGSLKQQKKQPPQQVTGAKRKQQEVVLEAETNQDDQKKKRKNSSNNSSASPPSKKNLKKATKTEGTVVTTMGKDSTLGSAKKANQKNENGESKSSSKIEKSLRALIKKKGGQLSIGAVIKKVKKTGPTNVSKEVIRVLKAINAKVSLL
mmetsp:Transcript_5487/g.7302  ORF Transcript_5487/g.7302 Transcript_5487/m.7302 type:complete len:231 (-) Transcript_5487:270-962(-)